MAKTPEASAAPASGPRNLTYDNLLVLVKAQRDQALALIPEHEAVEISVTERDEKGKPILKNGYPTIVKQAVLKRDLEAIKWQPKIDELIAMGARDDLAA
jgi:hypothetical protein